MHNLLDNFHGFPPLTDAELRDYAASSGPPLPGSYLSFLRTHNGGEGTIGLNGYVILWPVRELLDMNRAYEANELLPGFLLFGSNGGGEAFAFEIGQSMRIVSIPFVGMHPSLVEPVADDFPGLLQHLDQLRNS